MPAHSREGGNPIAGSPFTRGKVETNSAPKPLPRAAFHHRAGQRAADHVFGKARAFDQSVEIDAGLDAEFVAEKNKILRADVAGGALMAGEWTAAQSGDRGIEPRHAHFESGIGIADRHAARVMQMQSDVELRPALAQGTD